MPFSPEQFPSGKQPAKKEEGLDLGKTLEEVTQLADQKLRIHDLQRKHWKRGESIESKPKTAEEIVSDIERKHWEDQKKSRGIMTPNPETPEQISESLQREYEDYSEGE